MNETLTGLAAEIHSIIIANKNITEKGVVKELKKLTTPAKDKDGKDIEVAKYELEKPQDLLAVHMNFKVALSDLNISRANSEVIANYDPAAPMYDLS